MPHSITSASGGAVTHADSSEVPLKTSFWALTLGSIGVVYGDIGTSPLYAFREAAVAAAAGGAVNRTIVLGVLSLILWALIVVVDRKGVV